MSIRKMFAVSVLLLMAFVSSAFGQSTPQAQPLLEHTALKYLGSFVVPWDCGHSFFGYGGGGLAISPNGLYVAAFDQHRQIGEISIPALGGTATVLTPCAYPLGIDAIAPDTLVGGLLRWNNRVIVSGYGFYDGGGVAKLSHGAFNLLTGAMSQFSQVGTLGGGFVGGYMGVIPVEWRELLGGCCATGASSLSIIFRTSSGPSFHVFNPDDVGVKNPVPATTLLNYPLANPLAPDGGPANLIYQRSDTVGGFAFPAGTRSLLFFGLHGFGPNCYGEASQCGGDPARPDKGDHNKPYRFGVWAYDANDMLAVKAGKLQPHEVRPYAEWTLTTTGAVPAAFAAPPNQIGIPEQALMRPGGATYDPVTRRVYLAIPRWGERSQIHVFEIQAPTTHPPPVEICGNGLDDDGDGLIDEGCPIEQPEQFSYTETVLVPAESITVPAQTLTVPAKTITRTVVCTKPAGGAWSCVAK